jgi:copper chaperone
MEQQFQVSGMSCGHCVGAVTEAVHGVDRAAVVNVDLAAKTVKVQSSIDSGKLGAAIAAAGYDVRAVTT